MSNHDALEMQLQTRLAELCRYSVAWLLVRDEQHRPLELLKRHVERVDRLQVEVDRSACPASS